MNDVDTYIIEIANSVGMSHTRAKEIAEDYTKDEILDGTFENLPCFDKTKKRNSA